LTQRQRNRFDWGFRKAPHGRDGGKPAGKHRDLKKKRSDAANGGVLARVIYLTRAGPTAAYPKGQIFGPSRRGR
jgi:hypothetical protein